MTLQSLNPVVWQQIRNILLRAPGDGWMVSDDLFDEIRRRGINTDSQPAAACSAAVDAGWIDRMETQVPAEGGCKPVFSKFWYRAATGEGLYD